MNQINPRKLLNSKWTAVVPTRKEKHFIVSEVDYDDAGLVVECALEAVYSKRVRSVDWRQLKDVNQWLQGWK